MPYLQFWHGNWRVRRPIPKHLQPIIGRGACLTRSLGTGNRTEANRLAIPVLNEFAEMISLAEKGEYPPLSLEGCDFIARQWATWHDGGKEFPGIFIDPDSTPIFADTTRMNGSLTEFLAKHYPAIQIGGGNFERIKRLATELAYLTVKLEATAPTVPRNGNAAVTPPAKSRNGSLTFSELINTWAKSERNPTLKTKEEFDSKISQLTEFLKHDDAAKVTDIDIIRWKEYLLDKGRSHKTIENYLNVIKTLYNFAVKNKKLAVSPAKDISFSAKSDGRDDRLPFTVEDARLILTVARKESDPVIRWANWIAAFTGARLEEIVGAAAADIEQIDGVWCLNIRLDNRIPDATLKNIVSKRIVPLHPAIIDEGFLVYAKSVPKGGPLFPKLPPDKFGKRSGVATKRIGRWLRDDPENGGVGITDPRKVFHSWRHFFKDECDFAEIEEKVHDAITGHKNEKKVGRKYGSLARNSTPGSSVRAYQVELLAMNVNRLRNPTVESR
jgi:integrase